MTIETTKTRTDAKLVIDYVIAESALVDSYRASIGVLAVRALGLADDFGPTPEGERRAFAAVQALVAAGRLTKDAHHALYGLDPEGPQVRIYTIPQGRKDDFDAALVKLAAKAAKYGLAAPTAEVVGETRRVVVIRDPDTGTLVEARRLDGAVVCDRWLVIEVTEPVVVLPGGWRFLGTIQHTEAGNILRTVPGAVLRPGEISDFRETSATRCDHCRIVRRRKDTYLVRSAEGGLLQVGSTCIGEFLGRDLLGALETKLNGLDLSSFEEREFSGGRCEVIWDLDEMVGATATAVRTVGWTSRTASREYGAPPATADILQRVMFAWHPKEHAALQREYPEVYGALKSGIPEEDMATARAAIAWAREISPEEPNEYLHNLRVACTLDHATPRTIGLVASVIPAHARVIEAEIRRAREARTPVVSAWIGQVGDQIGDKLTASAKKVGATLIPVFEAEVIGKATSDGIYGMTTILKLALDDGRRAVWFASGYVGQDRGERVRVVRATIKSLNEFRGVKETVLTRVTLETVERS